MTDAEKIFDPFSNKPNISETSRKLYLFNLKKLNGGKEITNLKFLGKEDILERVNELKPNTRRTYLISIVSALKDRPEPKNKKLYAKFYEHLINLNKELKDNTEKSPKVKENWSSQEEVNDVLAKMKEIIPEIQNKKKITEDEYNKLLNLVVLSLYTLQAPRRNRDYCEMVIVKKEPESTESNYLDLSDWKWVFNNFKTQKKYQKQILVIPDELKTILQVYFKFHPKAKEIKAKKDPETPIHFLVHFDGSPISSSTEMTRLLNKIFGKKIGCSLLRAIFLTDKYGKESEELKKDTASMGTSVGTAMDNYIKQD
jgi:hypothetical protein